MEWWDSGVVRQWSGGAVEWWDSGVGLWSGGAVEW